MPCMPSCASSVFTNTVSQRAGPRYQDGVAWMSSRHAQPMPCGSVGETNIALAKWKTLIRPMKVTGCRVALLLRCWDKNSQIRSGSVGTSRSSASEMTRAGRFRAVSINIIDSWSVLMTYQKSVPTWHWTDQLLVSHQWYQGHWHHWIGHLQNQFVGACERNQSPDHLRRWISLMVVKLRKMLIVPKYWRWLEVSDSLSIPCFSKSTAAAASLSIHWFVSNIWPSALYLLERLHGSFTALICFDSVIDVQRLFGVPNCLMRTS